MPELSPHRILSDVDRAMSSDHLPPHFPPSSPEIPLDLTVKRTDMDPSGNNSVYNQSTQYTQGLSTTSGYQSTSADYNVQPGEQCGYYTTNQQQYQPVYNSDTPPSTSPPVMFQSTEPVQSPSTYYPSSPVQDYNQAPYERDSSSSCVLPKKRKNLWRPYDSRAAGRGIRLELEKDGDSSSDSNSSSSEQEFKTPATPMDPMKKRKRNMIRYAEEQQFDDYSKDAKRVEQSCSSSSQTSVVQPPKSVYSNTVSTSQTNTVNSFVPSQGSSEDPEMREHMISDFKKRDVFGWSLKLQQPNEDKSVGSKTTVGTNANNSSNVCKDGEKTYIELQTVKKQSPERSTCDDNISPPVSTGTNSIPVSPSSGRKYARKSPSPNKNDTKDSQNDNEKNSPNSRVFIQRRDNIIESVDETQNIPKEEKTKKGICLIDLIEEIEADTRKREVLEDTKKKNNNVRKLLEQCNFVKLQALDYLMANVLIQDNGPSFKNKNETVQKMLKGDKIGCVNMLDVIELQVEIGLN